MPECTFEQDREKGHTGPTEGTASVVTTSAKNSNPWPGRRQISNFKNLLPGMLQPSYRRQSPRRTRRRGSGATPKFDPKTKKLRMVQRCRKFLLRNITHSQNARFVSAFQKIRGYFFLMSRAPKSDGRSTTLRGWRTLQSSYPEI